jgi:hypothetical protein
MEVLNVYTPAQICDRLAAFLGIDRKIFYTPSKGGGKANENAYYRHLFVYCLWRFSNTSKRNIARLMDFDITCVYNSIEKINELCKSIPAVKAQVIKMEEMFE